MTVRVVAFCGYAGSGKSTAADCLARLYGYRRLRFAGPLKAMLRAFYVEAGIPPAIVDARIEGPRKEVPDLLLGGKSPRYAMQTLGTEWGRELLSPDIWTNVLSRRLSDGTRSVIEDCRFANEAAVIRRHGGLIIRIDRPGCEPQGDHVSETLPIEPDATIVNDGSIDELTARLRHVLSGAGWAEETATVSKEPEIPHLGADNGGGAAEPSEKDEVGW